MTIIFEVREQQSLKRLVKSENEQQNSGLRLIVKVRAFLHTQCEGNARDWD